MRFDAVSSHPTVSQGADAKFVVTLKNTDGTPLDANGANITSITIQLQGRGRNHQQWQLTNDGDATNDTLAVGGTDNNELTFFAEPAETQKWPQGQLHFLITLQEVDADFDPNGRTSLNRIPAAYVQRVDFANHAGFH